MFDHVAAVREHQQYTVDVRNAVMRKLRMDADRLRQPDCCQLGAWLESSGRPRYGHMPLFREVVQHHKALHQEVGRVADAVNTGRYPEALSMLESGQPLQRSSRAMVSGLKALGEQVQHAAAAVDGF